MLFNNLITRKAISLIMPSDNPILAVSLINYLLPHWTLLFWPVSHLFQVVFFLLRN